MTRGLMREVWFGEPHHVYDEDQLVIKLQQLQQEKSAAGRIFESLKVIVLLVSRDNVQVSRKFHDTR